MQSQKTANESAVDQIRFYQQERGSTNKKLFTAAGMTAPTWNKRMNLEGSFTLRELEAIAHVLGVELSDLIPLSEDEDEEELQLEAEAA